MLHITQLPALKDNYIYILRNEATGETGVIDPTLAAPVLEFLTNKKWQLNYIINTHHHWDHTDGNVEIKQATGAKVIGFKGDAHRIPGIDIEVADGQIIDICGHKAEIIFIPGHTLGHIAYNFKNKKILFCGDTLFSLGCGRLFEGTAEQMFTSLQKLAALPENTAVYCAHEYTQSNSKFAITIEPDNKDLQNRIKEVAVLRSHNKPTIPTSIELELKTNPFLRAGTVEEFARVRKMKDGFK
jgi:hydroxyacylglutathione hydrolase